MRLDSHLGRCGYFGDPNQVSGLERQTGLSMDIRSHLACRCGIKQFNAGIPPLPALRFTTLFPPWHSMRAAAIPIFSRQ